MLILNAGFFTFHPTKKLNSIKIMLEKEIFDGSKLIQRDFHLKLDEREGIILDLSYNSIP